MKLKFNQSKQGYTLIETVVVIGLFALIMSITYSLIVSFYRQNEYSIQQSAAITSARQAVRVLVQDIREVVVSEGGAYPLISVTPNSISFFSDIDRDDSVEMATYYINEDYLLVKETIEPSGVPPTYDPADAITTLEAEYIRNDFMGIDIFKYFDETGNEINDLDDVDAIRFIEVNLVVNVDPNRQPDEFVLRSSAYLRNLKPTLQ